MERNMYLIYCRLVPLEYCHSRRPKISMDRPNNDRGISSLVVRKYSLVLSSCSGLKCPDVTSRDCYLRGSAGFEEILGKEISVPRHSN